MNDRTAYWIARPSTPERAPHKGVAIILVALALVVLVVSLSGNAAHPSPAPRPLLVSDSTVDNPAAFTSMLAKVMSADASLGQAAYYVKQYPHARVWQANYEVMLRACLRAVAEYDAAASKYTLGALSAEGLPRRVDISAAPTDCRAPTP